MWDPAQAEQLAVIGRGDEGLSPAADLWGMIRPMLRMLSRLLAIAVTSLALAAALAFAAPDASSQAAPAGGAEIRLIVRGDDMGSSQASNEAQIERELRAQVELTKRSAVRRRGIELIGYEDLKLK